MSPLDPRLADIRLLYLAGLLVHRRQSRGGVRWIGWEDRVPEDEEPPGISLPRKAETIEAWVAEVHCRWPQYRKEREP
jgi:hypothetical protein